MPVTTTKTLGSEVEAVVDTVRVEEAVPVSDAGLRLAVTPVGWPSTVALKLTVPVNPFTA